MFTCSTLLLFPYPVPADIHRSVQHVTLELVPGNVLPRLFLLFSQVKHLECHGISPPQKVLWGTGAVCMGELCGTSWWGDCERSCGGEGEGLCEESWGSCEKSCGGSCVCVWPRCVGSWVGVLWGGL